MRERHPHRKIKTFSDEQALAALRDASDGGGMMWAPATGHEAALLWAELRRRGWVRAGSITDEGRKALGESDHG